MTTTFLQWSQPFSYDNGSVSSVGINDDGLIVEMHEGPGEDGDLYYRVGQFTTDPSGISWNPVYAGPDGDYPNVDVNAGYAVGIYQASDKDVTIQCAPLPATEAGVLNWTAGQNYTSGEYPAVAVNNSNDILAVHQDSKIWSTSLWYCVGSISDGNLAMGSVAEISDSDGNSMSGYGINVAMNDSGQCVVVCHGSLVAEANLCQLYLLAGTLANGTVTWGAVMTAPLAVQDGNSVDVALDNDGNLVIACTTSSVGGAYLGTLTATVANNVITLSPGLPLPLNYTTVLGNNVTVAINNGGAAICETSQPGQGSLFEYFVGQAVFNADYSGWMGDNLTTIGDIPLNLMALPGSHDSGTYAINATSPFSPDNPSFWSTFAPAICADWSQTQDLDFLQQLQAGIRYFDLRVCYSQAQGKAYYLCHGMYGAPLGDLFSALDTFYAASNTGKEIVVLDISHIYTDTGGLTWDGVDCWMPGGPNGQFPQLCDYINAEIGPRLLPPSLMGKTLNDILASAEYAAGGRVILMLNDTYSITTNANYWWDSDSESQDELNQYWNNIDGQTGNSPSQLIPAINSYWPNVATLDDLTSALGGTLQTLENTWTGFLDNSVEAESIPFTVLQCIGTEGSSQIEAGILGTGAPSLQSWEAGICSPSLFWLAKQNNAAAVNIILVDWLEQTLVTPLCIQLNQEKAEAITASRSV